MDDLKSATEVSDWESLWDFEKKDVENCQNNKKIKIFRSFVFLLKLLIGNCGRSLFSMSPYDRRSASRTQHKVSKQNGYQSGSN